jgi:hypothetical protein
MHTALSLYQLGKWLDRAGVESDLVWAPGSDIEELRNLFVSVWYDNRPDFSHLLFVDADMGFPPSLVGDMIRFNKPLMGAVYAKRMRPTRFVGSLREGEPVDGFRRANGVGCGVMMIAREVITGMLPGIIGEAHSMALEFNLSRVIRAFDKIAGLSEDMSFCKRWTDIGGEVWANVEHSISHIGPFDFRA